MNEANVYLVAKRIGRDYEDRSFFFLQLSDRFRCHSFSVLIRIDSKHFGVTNGGTKLINHASQVKCLSKRLTISFIVLKHIKYAYDITK